MKIVILDAYCANPGDLSWDRLKNSGELTVYDRTAFDEDEIVSRIGDSEIVLTNKTPLGAAVMARCEKLRYIGVLATGYNVVDIAAAKKRGITVTNIPSYSTAATAQFAVGLLLEICLHIGHHSDAVHAGRWQNCADFSFWDFPCIELDGKTAGIIGFGRIGKQVARILRALGMNIVAFSRSENDEGRALARYVTLDELLTSSDVVSLHCPLTEQTNGIINAANIAKMKDGAILINNSRGPVIVEQDVADALNSGKLSAAAVDVACHEPINADSPLLSAKNCIITPHISWTATEARARLLDITADNIEHFIAGSPINVVNK